MAENEISDECVSASNSDSQNTDDESEKSEVNHGYMNAHEHLSTAHSSPLMLRKNSLKGLNIKNRLQGSSFFGKKSSREIIRNYKPLVECTESEVEDIMIKKIQECKIIFDFVDVNSCIKEKEIKRNILIELTNFINDNSHYLTGIVYKEALDMIIKNIVRVLPPSEQQLLEAEEDFTTYEASWPHLQPKLASAKITLSFISQLLQLFDSEDPRERDSLKTVLHRIYGKFLSYRNSIRHKMNDIFLRFTHETEKFSGISELLEIYGSIINGFALPLKEEHKKFLVGVLLPMHKVFCVNLFHGQLTYCVLQFMEKDNSLTLPIMKALNKYWPKVSSQKEILFLNELEELLEMCDPSTFETIMEISFKILAKSCASYHFQVAERALCFFQNDYIVRNFAENSDILIPLVFDSLYKTSTLHWNSTINAVAINVLNVIIDINPTLCTRLAKIYQESLPSDGGKNKDFVNFMEKFTNLRFE